MTSTLLRAQNTTLLSKVRRRFFKFCGLLRKPKLYNFVDPIMSHTTVFIVITASTALARLYGWPLEVAEQKFKVKVGIEFYTAKTTSGRPLSLLSIAILSI